MNAHSKIKADRPTPAFTPKATLKKPVHCFAVRLSALLRVKPFIGKDEVRYYLHGAFVHSHKEGGAVCVATDGHRLGVRKDTDGLVNEPQIVRLPKELKAPPRTLLNPWAILTRTGKSYGHLSLVEAIFDRENDTAENAIARASECYQRFGDCIIDGTFPDYTRVIPTPSEGDVSRAFNGKYFASFGEHLTIRGGDDGAPHTVLDNRDQDFYGVLMPMRATEKTPQGWVKGISYPKASS